LKQKLFDILLAKPAPSGLNAIVPNSEIPTENVPRRTPGDYDQIILSAVALPFMHIV
jgi:hypothetical protein